jgi:hypothetical protein
VTFIIEANDFATRFNITFTIILTFIASKFSISSMVPVTNYMTYLDIYMVTSFAYLVLVAIQNTIYYSFKSGGLELASQFNKITGAVIVSTWCLLHCLIGVYIYYRYYIDKKPKSSLPSISLHST